MFRKNTFLYLILTLGFLQGLCGSETIHSYLDQYYNNLSLLGISERPYLNYKSYSTNNWKSSDGAHPWAESIQERTPLWQKDDSALFLTDTSLFQSYNGETPHGINDGGLWQGKGYNAALAGGLQFDSPFVAVTIFPELYFSQNRDYSILPSDGSEFGYHNSNIDLPQRFGNEAFWYSSLGQSQIRFSYQNWTLGIGNENVWLGPGQESALIWSNNADGFPHIDLGLNRTETKWGDVEFRLWWGWLKSSEYFEEDPGEYKDFLSGMSMSYAPFFIPNLTLGFNKTMQVALDNFVFYNIIGAADLGLTSGMRDFGRDVNDGRASFTWSWMFPENGFEFYGEWCREDFTSGLEGWLRKPEHADGFTLGAKQVIPWKGRSDRFFTLNAEFSSTTFSMDYFIGQGWGAAFYRHPRTTLGYANNGQTIGAGYGTGANLQHFEVDYYAPFGMAGVYATRIKHDDSSLYAEQSTDGNEGIRGDMLIPYQVAVGFKGTLLCDGGFSVNADAAYIFEKNWNMVLDNDYYGLYLGLGVVWRY